MFKNKVVLILASLTAVLAIAFFSTFSYLYYQVRDIKAPLLDFLKSQIAGDLQIGDAQVNFIPPGINLENTKLYAPGDVQPSASIGHAELRFSLIPLVRKKIEASLVLDKPEILLHRSKDGKSDMEKIFAPLMSGETKVAASSLDQFWWKRLAIDKLKIVDAHFKATREGSEETIELRNLDIAADHIRFDAERQPAKLRIRYLMPQISQEPMELNTRMTFEESTQGLRFSEGDFRWGESKLSFDGQALLPSPERKEVALDLHFGSKALDLKKIGKMLVPPLPASGTLALAGSVTGTAFAPLIKIILDSPALTVSGKTLSNLHAELSKKEKPIEIQNTSFGIYGGTVGLSGEAVTGPTTSANVNVALKSLSLAAASGKSGNPARLSGNLKLASQNVSNPYSFSGGGNISVGPFPLPVVDLKGKVKVAEILASGTAAGQMINVGMLSSSANLIGTQVDTINASVRIAGNNITLAPFSMANGHFSASGNATIAQQKSINGSGTFHLNPGVTASLITDPMLRSAVTGGKGGLSIPFSISGPLDDPNITVDSGYLQGLIAKATAIGLKNMLMGGLKPQNMLNSALKNTPLGDPKNPLSQILGTSAAPPPSQPQARNASAPARSPAKQNAQPSSPRDRRNQAIQNGINGLLFGK